MKKKVYRIIKAICFCLIVVIMVNGITNLLKPKWLENRWQSAKTNNTFYNLEKDSVDIFFVGSSVIAAAVDPYQLYNEYGFSSYNLGVMQQPTVGTYFWLKEVLKTQSPKLIVMEVKTVGRVEDKDESSSRKSYDYMKWGKNKLQYAIEYAHTNKEADLFEYLFPLSKYHTRWSELTYDDWDFFMGDDTSYTRGFATLTTRFKDAENFIEWKGIKEDPSKIKSFNSTNESYCRRIVDLAKENNIDILFVKTPDTAWTTSRHNHIVNLSKELGVDFIDFNIEGTMKSAGIDYSVDGADTNHLNMNGAKKFTSYIGDYLKKKYDLTNYKNGSSNKVKETYESEMKNYNAYYSEAMVCMEKGIEK